MNEETKRILTYTQGQAEPKLLPDCPLLLDERHLFLPAGDNLPPFLENPNSRFGGQRSTQRPFISKQEKVPLVLSQEVHDAMKE
jgi:hypothetical protein